jgi:hypothetical protein
MEEQTITRGHLREKMLRRICGHTRNVVTEELIKMPKEEHHNLRSTTSVRAINVKYVRHAARIRKTIN